MMDAVNWTARVDALRKSGGGALTLTIVMPADRAKLARRAEFGDPRSKRLRLTLHEMDQVISARSDRTLLCSTCSTPIRGKSWAAVIVAPELSTDPVQALGLVICTRCGPTFSAV